VSELDFHIEHAAAIPFAAMPTLGFRLRIVNASGQKIHSTLLRCQILIEATKRRYSAKEQQHLRDLFGEPEQWSKTLRSMLWTHVSAVVPAFESEQAIELLIPCSFDFNVAATKFFYGLDSGDISLLFQFSGSVFYESEDGSMLVAPISWDKEARFRLQVNTWRKMMDLYYPNTAWLCLRRDIFDRIYQYKVQNGIPTIEKAMEQLFASALDIERKETVGL